MRKKVKLATSTQNVLSIMGEQIKLARLRRNLSAAVVSSRAHISRPTLLKIEKGAPDVAIGTYANVLQVLGGLDQDLLLIARDDVSGRTIQDLNMKIRKRASKR